MNRIGRSGYSAMAYAVTNIPTTKTEAFNLRRN